MELSYSSCLAYTSDYFEEHNQDTEHALALLVCLAVKSILVDLNFPLNSYLELDAEKLSVNGDSKLFPFLLDSFDNFHIHCKDRNCHSGVACIFNIALKIYLNQRLEDSCN